MSCSSPLDGIEALVFDLDDTLSSWQGYARSGLHAVDVWLKRYHNLHGFIEAVMPLFESGQRSALIDHALELLECPSSKEPHLASKAVRIYRSHIPQIELYPDVASSLDVFSKRYQLGLITDGIWEAQTHKIEALGLAQWIPSCICTDGFHPPAPKPNPQAYLILQRAFNCPPQACAYIADNPHKDFITPNALGWKTIHIHRPNAEHAQSPSPGPPYNAHTHINSLTDLQPPL